jgi:hypothetical protein
VTTKNILARLGSANGEESIALKRAQDLEKKRRASNKAQKEEARNAKRRKAVVEVGTHAVTVFETIAARGLGTIDSLQVDTLQDMKAMLQRDDPEAPEAKANKAGLRDRVLALV